MRFSIFLAVLWLVGNSASAQGRNYPPKLPEARVEVYKRVGDVSLNAYIFEPEDHRASDQRAAIVFFFGGGWRAGSPGQFHQHCLHLRKRGMVAITCDYRVLSRHQTKAISCVEDAKSAVRWVRANAKRLGVDPDRIAAGGGSAGGHLAACTGVIKGREAADEDTAISSRPNAMVLFNPALVLSPISGELPLSKAQMETLPGRMGTEPVNLSPYHHVAAGAPPTVIFHGKGDTTVPYKTAELFAKKMNEAGNRCVLYGYPDQPHGFFNYGRDGNKHYEMTVKAMDRFLASLGYLDKP